jgi:hypothetical protein
VTVLQEHYRAFEVLGQTESGAAAACLPRCFSMSNEVKGQDTDNFDPWRADCVDVSHYISIVAGMMPHFAREKRLWELLRLYRREWFLWLGGRVMQDSTLAHNHDLVRNCDYVLPGGPNDFFYRLAARQFYHPRLMAVLRDFARATGFREAAISARAEAGTIPDKTTFDALVSDCFYDWVDHFWAHHTRELSQFKTEVSRVNPRVQISSYGPVAVYGGIYKTAHACTYAGCFNFRPEMEAFCDGFFILEDYPHACRYSLHSGPFFLASFKARAPQVAVYPELYNETGDKVPCPDAAVARAWPSYGMWDGALPVNASLKHVLEYVYGCVWHNGQGFGYWQDHGFHTRVWERERFAALLQLWGFVDKARPRRPLRANAFICNEDCCRNHRLYYDEYPGDGHEAYGDLFNTAEECSAYCYEMSRTAGQNAGFVTDFGHLSALSASDIDVLVLPPLTCVSADALQEVRRLHEAGVGLLGFEVITGLEDLFGVTTGEPVQVHHIRVNEALKANPLAGLSDQQEYTEHRACVGTYRATTADVLLDAEAPVLFLNQTPWGRAALYSIPPTAVRRQDQFNRVAVGRASIGRLINEATRLVLRHLSRPVVETTEGKIIAFEDEAGLGHIIVAEDAHPLPARPIRPVVTINLPGLEVGEVRCNKDFTVIPGEGREIRLGVRLDPDEFAIISLPQAAVSAEQTHTRGSLA